MMYTPIKLGPFVLPASALVIFIALMMAGWASRYYERRLQISLDRTFYLSLGSALILGRIVPVITHWDIYSLNPWRLLDIRDGQINLWVFILTLIMTILYMERKRWNAMKALISSLMAGVLSAVIASTLITWMYPPIDYPLPHASLMNLKGQSHTLSMTTNKAKVINIWATWCPPCRREIPAFLKAQAEHPNIDFFYINAHENTITVHEFVSQHALPPDHVWLDPDSLITDHFNIKGMPTTLFYNAQGQLSHIHVGEISSTRLALELRRLSH